MELVTHITIEHGFWLWFAGVILGIGIGIGIQKIIGPPCEEEKESNPEILDD